jgi:excisionase family DNA binding protein
MKSINDKIEHIKTQLNILSNDLTKINLDIKKSDNLENLEEEVYLSVDELTNYIKLSKSIIYTLRKHKMIPFVKIKNQYLFIKKDIDLWIENCQDRITYETVSERLNV